jgi:hypothetical protein
MRPIFTKPPPVNSPYKVSNIPLPTDNNDLPLRRSVRPPPVIKSPAIRGYNTETGPHGRDTTYSSHYAHVIFKLRLLGFSEDRIAYVLGVGRDTLMNWKRNNLSLQEAWNNGGDFADANVAQALYERAVGYVHEDTKVFFNSQANNGEGELVYAQLQKHYPPDTTAAQFWLTNRARARWRNQQSMELTGADGKDLAPPKLQINFVSTPKRVETISHTPEVQTIEVDMNQATSG